MSRIEDADKIRRSIERGDPQPTAMSKDQREAWKGIKAMTQDDEQRALEAFKLEFGLEEETLEQIENGYKLLWPAWRNSWEACLQSKASEGLKEFLKDFPEIESDHDNTGFVLSPTPKASEGAGDGWQLVPVEPTLEMLKAGKHIYSKTEKMWSAMLAAAPKPTETKP